MKQSNRALYLLVLFAVAGVIAAALGGGLWEQAEPWWVQWQHQAFVSLCHQIPERSFWINGQPMAVCSRCLGIYAAFGFGWLSLPLLAPTKWLPTQKLLIAAILLNLIDLIGNFSGFWENTLISRLMLGAFLGLTAALLFSGSFFNRKIKITGTHHGRITTGV